MESLEQWLIKTRREFHQIPEKSFNEFKTQALIIDILDSIGIPHKKVAGTGIVGEIKGQLEGNCIAIRADMDALEVTEILTDRNVNYISKHPGLMHACGHDAHISMVLGVGKLLNESRDNFNGTVKLIFQPAEELPPGGAKQIIQSGVLENVDSIIGLHVFSNIESGTVIVKNGTLMASSCMFRLRLFGKGGHHSDKVSNINPILLGAEFIDCIHKEIELYINSSDYAIGFGNFHSGEQFNRIPDEAYIDGSIRSFSIEHNKQIKHIFKKTLDEIIQAYSDITSTQRAHYELEMNESYPILSNNSQYTAAVLDLLEMKFDNISSKYDKFFGSEDFAFYLEKIPGTFLLLGSGNEQKDICESNHSNKFDIDEDILIKGTNILYSIAIDFLESPEKYLE